MQQMQQQNIQQQQPLQSQNNNQQAGYHSQSQQNQSITPSQYIAQLQQYIQYYQHITTQYQAAQQQQGYEAFQQNKEFCLLKQKLSTTQNDLKQLEEESQTEISQYKQKVKGQKQEIDTLSQKNSELDFDLKETESKRQVLQKKYKDMEQKNQELNRQINQQNQELEEKNGEIANLQNKEKQLVFLKTQSQDSNFQNMIKEKDNEIFKLKGQITQMKNEIENYKAQQQKMRNEFEGEKANLQEEVNKEHRQFLASQDVIKNWQGRLQQAENQIKQKDQNISDLLKTIQSQKIEKTKLANQISTLQENWDSSKVEIANLGQVIEQLKNYLQHPQASIKNELKQIEDDIKKIKEMSEQQQQLSNQKNKENMDKILQQQEQQKQKQNEKLEKLAQQKREAKHQGKSLVAQLMTKATEVQGQLDICYIIDSTISMEPYIQQARRCVRDSLKIIKASTNRDTNVSAICYYDIEQRPKEGNHQLNFTKKPQELEDFLDKIRCVGGRDIPEDVQGAFEQMLTKIEWKNKYRLAILITDAPCHGQKYHKERDFHPHMDITETLQKIANNGIILIGFNLKEGTLQMYDEFQKVFKDIQKQDQFFRVEVSGQQVDKLADQMAKTLGQASEQATQVKNQGTKSKKQQQERPENKDGAMEALCKQGNFYNFENQENVVTVKTNFIVYKVEISDQAFEDNFKQINKIGQQNNHYQITNEGKWDCIRTDKPFAFGMMKDVFLMKKVNAMENELFVIKTPIGSQPYPTLELAIAECRSHLICQKLVKKFRADIDYALEQSKQNLNVPNVNYSDFLILQENNGKFWIAEKFFKGEFVKYNNNFGFINPDLNELNQFAQAFSYYTFFISNGKYLVNDVQGVGNYFTDPAINTDTGDFDDTDLGLEGQQMYLVSFEWKNHIAYEYLKVLDIQYQNDDAAQQKIQG